MINQINGYQVKEAQNPSNGSLESPRPAPERVWVATSSLLRGYGYTYLASDGGDDLVGYVRADLLAPSSDLLAAAKAALKYVDNMNEETPVDQNCPECMDVVFYTPNKGPQPAVCWIHLLEKAVKGAS